MLAVKDRVRETTVTTGINDYVLAGSPIGFQPFSEIGVGKTAPYVATDDVNWEVGIGTIGAGILERTTVLASSNGGLAVNWGAGTKQVFCTLPAAYFGKAISEPTIQVLTSGSGTYTTPLGATRLRVRLVGGGGGGEGGGTSPGTGTNGGNTSFGTIQANGGSGGTGGSASGGDINVVGGAGQSRPNNSSSTFGGRGGETTLGGGGRAGDNGSGAGAAGGSYGGGGGGGGSATAGWSGQGGGGGGYAEKLIVAPSASYAYAIGAGGTAGAAGTGGTAGGAGAGGLIIIEEYYS